MNRIKILLIENNRTNKDLMNHLGVTAAAVSRWCTNKRQPNVETLYKIAIFLNVDVRELLQPSKK